MTGIDCAGGLARCRGGVIELSLAKALPVPCNGPPESCACPWQAAEQCPAGCAVEDTEIVASAAVAAEQLCTPADGAAPNAYFRPIGDASAPTGVCQGERYRCAGAVLYACATLRTVGACLHGCRSDTVDDPTVDDGAAAAILCAR